MQPPDVPALFAAALDHHRAGRTSEAEACCRQLLAADPNHAPGLYLLGVLALQGGNPEAAVGPLRRAIAIAGDVPAYYCTLGHVLATLGQMEPAVACLRQAIARDPCYAEAHNNLGNALRAQGALADAAASLRQAIALRPDYPEAHANLGSVLADLGELDAAVASYRHALTLRADYPQALNNLGNVLGRLGRLEEAAAALRTCVALRPDYAGAHNNLGNALAGLGRWDEATECFRTALALRPDLPESHNNLGNALLDSGRLEEAEASLRRALALRPDYPDAHHNLGNVLSELGRWPEAEATLRHALTLAPRHAEAHNSLGRVLGLQGDHAAALASYRQAIALRPNYPDAHFNLALSLLALGRMAEGWQEYEWRWRTPQAVRARRDFTQPAWRGEPLAGRTLLIHAEQGFGDTLQFCRYAPLAAARGATVVLEVQTALVRLLRGMPGADLVLPRGAALPDFDLHCPMLSLPLALGPADIQAAAPSYLAPEQDAAATWAARLAGPGLRVGLVWAGHPRTNMPAVATMDRRRSLAPERLAPLFKVPGVRFFSLQKIGPAAPASLPMTDFMAEIQDFADTAALVANLDLVISVDTAVAHLAAALGRPVWLLDRFDSCWRWLTGRRDSPWYPSLRIYRQPAPGDWDPVLAEVAADLRGLAR
jgi:tetratricopeptide (TPR) repeat protein